MRKWLAVLLVMGLMMVGLTGCGSKEQATNADVPANSETKTEQGNSSDLSSIMKSASQVKGMSFDTVTTITSKDGNITTNGKFYMSNGKVRMETEMQGMKMITITKNQGEVYLYNPTTKTAMKISALQDKTELPNEWANQNGDVSGLKVIGEEKMDGFDCVVVETTAADDKAKMWIRKDIGMPVRIEAATADGSMVTEYKNYNTGDQPDNLFELPAGTQITDMPALPDMSNLSQ